MDQLGNNLETFNWAFILKHLINRDKLLLCKETQLNDVLKMLNKCATSKVLAEIVQYFNESKQVKDNIMCLEIFEKADLSTMIKGKKSIIMSEQINTSNCIDQLVIAKMLAVPNSRLDSEISGYLNQYCVPEPFHPPPSLTSSNPLPGAADCIIMKADSTRGRHITAARDIANGEILFIEAPSAFAVNQSFLDKLCHYCGQTVSNIIACASCCEVVFCSERCMEMAYKEYHYIDCGFVEFLQKLGVAHIALRCMLVAGSYQELRNLHEVITQDKDPKGGVFQGGYPAVYSLDCHNYKMAKEDKLQYAITALLLTEFLQKCTTYFPDNATSDDVLFVAGILVRHILQLVYNAHAVVNSSLNDVGDEHVVGISATRVAVGIFPSTAMMNHSCDPNIVTSFYGNVVVVRASGSIRKGEEVFNCYGPHFRRMNQKERLEVLSSQYKFLCNCRHCTSNFDFTDLMYAYKCANCSGPLVFNEKYNQEWGFCWGCKSKRPVSIRMQQEAQSCADTFDSFANGEEVSLECLISKWRLAYNLLYVINDVTLMLSDAIGQKLALMGNYTSSVVVQARRVAALRARFGNPSPALLGEVVKVAELAMFAAEETESIELNEIYKNYASEATRICGQLYGTDDADFFTIKKHLGE